ncbi:MAG TPA: class I SAM-dependent methyltransferase [Cyclobacteriaceae bacterium]|nr:class I SAM-dependent methyltransferase [Cyclobacteriaceae bacterium]
MNNLNSLSLRKRFFAWILKKGDAVNDKIYGSFKKDLFKNISGRVAEIGPGTGVNFSFLPKNIEWIGIEPNPAFHETLRTKAEAKGIKANLVSGTSDDIPLGDNALDVVLSTLVLCSVEDPAKTIAEIKRVLKPGGRFFFIEHVASAESKSLLFAQNICNPFNRLAADGCNCNRRTWTFIQHGGFSEVNMKHVDMKGTLILHKPHIMGYAVK